MAQSGECPTLDLSSGLALRDMSSGPVLCSVLGVEPYANIFEVLWRLKELLDIKHLCIMLEPSI